MSVSTVSSVKNDNYDMPLTAAPKDIPVPVKKNSGSLVKGLMGLTTLGAIGVAGVAVSKNKNIAKELKVITEKFKNSETKITELKSKLSDSESLKKELEAKAEAAVKSKEKAAVKEPRRKKESKGWGNAVLLDETQKKVQELEAKVKGLEEENAANIAEKTGLQKQVDKLRDFIKQFIPRRKQKAVKNSIIAKEKAAKLQRRQSSTTYRETYANRAKMDAELQRAKDTNTQLEAELRSANDRITELTEKIEKHKAGERYAAGELYETEEMLNAAKAEISDLKARVAMMRHEQEVHELRRQEIEDACASQGKISKAKTWLKVKFADIRRAFSKID